MSEMRHKFEGDKYEVVFNEKTGDLYALRHGEAWQHLHGNKLILAMLQEVDRLHKLTVPRVTGHEGLPPTVGSESWCFKHSERFCNDCRIVSENAAAGVTAQAPIPMILHCPHCRAQHIDQGEWATKLHRTHLCAECDCQWRPAKVPTVGVQKLSS